MVALDGRKELELNRRQWFAGMLTVLATSIVGCGGGPADPDKFPDPGQIVVHVADSSGKPVSNVLVELRTPDLGLVWRSGSTDAGGRVEIGQSQGGVLPGDYAVTIKLPTGYALAPGQAASTPVTIKSNQQTDVIVMLAP